MSETLTLLFEDDPIWRSKIKEIWMYHVNVSENQESNFHITKFKIDTYDLKNGEIILFEPEFEDTQSIDVNELPYITGAELENTPIQFFEVIAQGYKNAYVKFDFSPY